MNNTKQSSVEKEFVLPEEALALKELGFDEPCFAYYQKSAVIGKDTILPIQIMNTVSNFNDNEYSKLGVPFWSAPTYSQAFRWFREKYGLYYFEDHRCNSKTDISSITYWMGIKKLKLAPFGSEVLVGIIELGCYNTYEEAEISYIKHLIEIVKTYGGKNNG